MSTNWIFLLAAPALVAPLVWTNETCTIAEENQSGKLTRVGAQEPSEFDAQAWKDRLRAADLDARERDFEKLVEETRVNDAARAQLEEWARDGGDSGLAWTSRLALREARNRSTGAQPFGPRSFGGMPGDPHWNDLRARLEDMQSRFGGMDDMFERLQHDMDRAFGGSSGPRFHTFPPGAGQPGTGGFQKSRSQIYSMEVGPDGVKVEVSEDVDGKQERNTYTAKTLEELYEAHPELKDKMGARIDVQTGPMRRWSAPGRGVDPDVDLFGRRADDLDRPARPLLPSTPRTDMLGVHVTPPDEEESERAGLDEGVGLKVGSVEPGTIAERIGVEVGDIVVDVNGKTIRSIEDVRDTLRDRKSGDDVSVTVVDESGKRRVLTWRAGKDEKKSEERRF